MVLALLKPLPEMFTRPLRVGWLKVPEMLPFTSTSPLKTPAWVAVASSALLPPVCSAVTPVPLE